MADLPEDEALHAEVEDDPRAGAAAGRRLIAQGATALVCASDSLALGAETAHGIGMHGVALLDATGQIGRASCRERV